MWLKQNKSWMASGEGRAGGEAFTFTLNEMGNHQGL